MRMKKVLLYVCFFAVQLKFLPKLFAQENEQCTITGIITAAETGAALSGVSVTIKGNKQGTSTKGDGTYVLKAFKGQSIVFSSVGFDKQEIKIKKSEKIDVILKIATVDAQEVVVIGYGTAKKSNVTGAVSKYRNEKMDEAPLIYLDQALQGKIAGVQVQNVSSESGAEAQINIRGISSINAGSGPLVVVDGQPIPDGLAFVNMADVESIEVLKDAASAAIYGSRGASGVILITTKSGKAERTKYSFKYSIGSKTDYKRYDHMTDTEYLKMLMREKSLRVNDPDYPINVTSDTSIASGDRAAYIIENTMRGGHGTDWQSESLRPGLFNTATLSATGGKKEMTYFISGSYQKEEGMMYKSSTERYSFRTKLDITLSKNVKLSVNLNPSFAKKETPEENFTNFARYPSFLPVYHNASTAAAVNTVAQWANIKPGDFAQPRHFAFVNYDGYMPDSSYFSGIASPSGSAQNNPRSAVLNSDINTNTYRLQSSVDLNINVFKKYNGREKM